MDNKHLSFLNRVVNQDVAGLIEKEKTYKSSWKKSGGRSAWFMIKRKLDRLINILDRPEEPTKAFQTSTDELNYYKECSVAEDIFGKITAEEKQTGGRGLDGSVLAEIRDLRRYLVLVEAEMYARGVVDYDSKDDENLHGLDDGA